MRDNQWFRPGPQTVVAVAVAVVAAAAIGTGERDLQRSLKIIGRSESKYGGGGYTHRPAERLGRKLLKA